MNGYFLTADVLGFSNIVKNSNEEDLSKRISTWVEITEKAAEESQIDKFQLVSDTVFAACDSTPEGLSSIILFAKLLLQNGISASLPVRGAITHGSFEWGTLTYGKAVIKSHELESNQDWIGVICESSLPHVEQMWEDGRLICYPPPLKKGSVTLYPVVVWAVPEFDQLTSTLTSNGLTKNGENLSWPWAQKVRNTTEFGSYLEMSIKSGRGLRHFSGFLPIQAIVLNARSCDKNA